VSEEVSVVAASLDGKAVVFRFVGRFATRCEQLRLTRAGSMVLMMLRVRAKIT
jgi:hypothetical protein